MMLGRLPLAGTITERPIGITFAGGVPCRPTRGCSTRVNWPGGSLPMISRTSQPSASSACACSSACSTTAPQNDQENGTTMPTFTGGLCPTARQASGATGLCCRDGHRARADPTDGGDMKLEGIHHVTCITGDAPRNVDFYARLLGLRLVKKTVNQDDPTVYHLFYADEQGSAGSDITFFEYPGVSRGRAGDGMV